MTLTQKTIFTALLFKVSLMIALTLTSCSKEEVGGGDSTTTPSVESAVSLRASDMIAEATNGEVHITANVGTTWSAEITDGGDFVSFNLRDEVLVTNGTVTELPSPNILYFYLDSNTTFYEREATITFTFDGESPVELTFKQYNSSDTDDPYVEGYSTKWAELPEKIEDGNYIYVSHSAELANGASARNYSLCFAPEHRAAAWVAFPYHKVYDGDVGRNERWTYDPKLPTSIQPNLTNSYSGSYDRGHQMASADRQATVEMNQQTFYYSNMTPQLGTLNQQKWATFEGQVRDQVCSDTLYVVTGADYTTTIGTTTDRDGNVCTLPGAYFKVMLRTVGGNTGKAIQDCSADELQAIGFWFEHKYYSAIPEPLSVKEIEELTGFTFFPLAPDSVKESFKSSQWSF